MNYIDKTDLDIANLNLLFSNYSKNTQINTKHSENLKDSSIDLINNVFKENSDFPIGDPDVNASSLSKLAELRSQSSSTCEIITYVKGEEKTRSKEIQTHEQLGKGGAGTVFSCVAKTDCVIKKSNFDLTYESQVGSLLDHRNLVRVYTLYIKQYPERLLYKLLMEKVEGKSLKDIRSIQVSNPSEKKITNEQLLDLTIQLKDCLLYLYQSKIIPVDTNLGNIMITHDNILKLLDFDYWRVETNNTVRAKRITRTFFDIISSLIACSDFHPKVACSTFEQHSLSAFSLSSSQENEDMKKNLTKNFDNFIKSIRESTVIA